MLHQLDRVNKLIFVKEYEKAEELLNSLLGDPDLHTNLLLHLRKIELSAKLGSVQESQRKYESQLRSGKIPEDFGKLVVLYCKQYNDQNDSSEIIFELQKHLKDYGPSAGAYYGLAFSMEEQSNFDRAIYNYEQSIKIDPDWYPSYFGLSQIYYSKGEDTKGDHYFYLFEQAAPFNLYGNFETHKKLSQVFATDGNFDAAEAAIKTLSEWWLINKGACPPEIQVYEFFALSKLADQKGSAEEVERLKARGIELVRKVLDSESARDNVLYFIAKVLEEYGQFELALLCYKSILRKTGHNPVMIQKIGSQFLSIGEFEIAREIFEEAYLYNPDNSEIRFCLLVSKLRLAGINVEEYLIGRERLAKLIDNPSEQVEALALLHALYSKYRGDAFVHAHLGELYLRMGNPKRAQRYFQEMYDIDGLASKTVIKYASFLMQHGDADEAIQILDDLDEERLDEEMVTEVIWLKSNFYNRKREYSKASEYIKKILQIDPWSVAYLIQEIVCLSNLTHEGHEENLDKIIEQLKQGEETAILWDDFDETTDHYASTHRYEIVYARQKLRFLYSQGDYAQLQKLVKAGTKFDAMKSAGEFIRLLNTNFDGPNIYYALGLLFKELWQLETSSMWFKQLLLHYQSDDEDKRKAYLELGDNYTWQNTNLQKAIEYLKLAMEMGERENEQAIIYLAHAYMRSGKMQEARIYLNLLEASRDVEAIYVKGLYQYRNGAREEASAIWKPLLTMRIDQIKFHHLKQEIMRYYFDHQPYLKAN